MPETQRVAVHGLKVARILHDFVVNEVLPGTGIEASAFWLGLDRIIHRFAPLNRALLQRRDAPAGQNRRLVSTDGGDVPSTRPLTRPS